MSNDIERECERCGSVGPGRERWMFYRWQSRFPESPITRQFFCHRCLRTLRLQAGIAITFGVAVVGTIIYVAIRIDASVPAP